MFIKAVITTLDNLPLLKEQVAILQDDSLIDEIVVVNNGSRDGTKEWLEKQSEVVAVNRENRGAGPGRNSGLDAAGNFDYVLMLDGGIRPLRNGTQRLLEYMQQNPEIDVLGLEIPHFETDYEKAWRRWPASIENSYQNLRLSHTAYCLAKYKAFDGLRFSEEGPFGEAGWGADDDEMACQWQEAGIVVHVVTDIHPYRRASGSFTRLFRETGIWPNQYGSVYEKRVVWLQQNWPQYAHGNQWGEPWITIVIKADGIENTAGMIKLAHNQLKARVFASPWDYIPNPYSIVLWLNECEGDIEQWARDRCLRQHHGDTIISDGQIIKRTKKTESEWAGDFRLCFDKDWRQAIRLDSGYCTFVTGKQELKEKIEKYNSIHPAQPNMEGRPKERWLKV